MRKTYAILLLFISLFSCMRDEGPSEIEWIHVEGGKFIQGEHQFLISPKGDTIRGFTSPYREVELDAFFISKYEITVKQFRKFCQQTGRKMPNPPHQDAYGQTGSIKWQDEHPMMATWHEADAFAKWAGGRLPTEAEWEYAAKGGTKSKAYSYSGSNVASEVGWVRENSDSSAHPVGQLKPNELGLYDMTGNLSEWVADWYNPEFDDLSDYKNPQGPPAGVDELKISKGLSWYYGAVSDEDGTPLLYSIHLPEVRYQSPPDTRNDGFGFRIVKDSKQD